MSATNKEIIETVNASFGENNIEGFLKYCADDVVWRMVGEKTVNGPDGIREFVKSMGDMEPPQFTVSDLVAEGDIVVCRGEMTMKDKDGKAQPYSFCDIYKFRGNQIAELSSYVIKTDAEPQTDRSASA
jgi:uncharacterized protein